MKITLGTLPTNKKKIFKLKSYIPTENLLLLYTYMHCNGRGWMSKERKSRRPWISFLLLCSLVTGGKGSQRRRQRPQARRSRVFERRSKQGLVVVLCLYTTWLNDFYFLLHLPFFSPLRAFRDPHRFYLFFPASRILVPAASASAHSRALKYQCVCWARACKTHDKESHMTSCQRQRKHSLHHSILPYIFFFLYTTYNIKCYTVQYSTAE